MAPNSNNRIHFVVVVNVKGSLVGKGEDTRLLDSRWHLYLFFLFLNKTYVVGTKITVSTAPTTHVKPDG